MKKYIKVVLPLAIGLFFIYLSFSGTTPEDRQNIIDSIQKADFRFIILSAIFGLLSHLIRSYRWKYMLNPLGYKPRFINSTLSILAAYLANLGIPRSGEVFRATLMTNYEKIPFEKGFGTIVAERIVDLVILLLLCGIGLFLQYDIFIGIIQEKEISVETLLIYLLLVGALFFGGYYLIKKFKKDLFEKIKKLLKGLLEGLFVVFKMKKKGLYLFHTILIWVLYYLMFYIVIFCFDETSTLGFDAILIGFLAGGLSISATNGGIGLYPYVVSVIFIAYGVSKEASLAFGWVIWTTQTALILIFGGLSFIFFPLLNRKKN